MWVAENPESESVPAAVVAVLFAEVALELAWEFAAVAAAAAAAGVVSNVVAAIEQVVVACFEVFQSTVAVASSLPAGSPAPIG